MRRHCIGLPGGTALADVRRRCSEGLSATCEHPHACSSLHSANYSKHNGLVSKNPLNDLGSSLGEYLREQRTSAKLSLRQLSELAGVSNPYLSQIERGLKRPSAEILQQLAKGLEVSAESLYVKAGILDAEVAPPGHGARRPRRHRRRPGAHPAAEEDPPRHLRVLRRGHPTAMTPTRTTPRHTNHDRPAPPRRRDTCPSSRTSRRPSTPPRSSPPSAPPTSRSRRCARPACAPTRPAPNSRPRRQGPHRAADLAPANVQARATKVADQVKEIPAVALNQTLVVGGKFAEGYDELAARGHKLVTRIQNQKATQDLVAQAETTVAQAKGAVTSARKATADIERSAKATITTGRKEAAKVVTVVSRLRRRGDQGREGRGQEVGQAHPHRGQAHDDHDQERHQEGHHLRQGRDDQRSQDRRRRGEGHREGRREGRHPGREAGHPDRR